MHDLHFGTTAPPAARETVVDAEIAGGGALADARGLAPGDCVDRAGAVGEPAAPAAPANRAKGRLRPGGAAREHGPRVAGPVRLEALEVSEELVRDVLERKLRFRRFAPHEVLARHAPGEVGARLAPEGVEVLRGDGSADRLVVPAEVEQPVPHFFQGRVERQSGDAPPRGRRPVSLESEEQHGPVVFPRQPRRRDPEHAAMPRGVSFDDQRVPLRIEGALDALARRQDDAAFDRLPFGVPRAQLRRDFFGASRVPLLEERERELRGVEPAGRVQARRDPERDFLGGRGASRGDPALPAGARRDPARAARQRGETESGDGAVLAGERDDVGNRSEARRPEKGLGRQGDPRRARDSEGELERHARAGEVDAGVGASRHAGVDDHGALGHVLRNDVVIRHDDVDSRFAGAGHSLDGGDAAVHGHDDGRRELVDDPADRVGRESVSILQAVRDEGDRRGARAGEGGLQLRNRGNPVDVVVPENNDPLAGARGGHEPIRCFRHSGEEERVVQVGLVRPEEEICLRRRGRFRG